MVAQKNFNLGDYVEVSERIVQFREKHPDGSLQSEVVRYPDDGFPFFVAKAYAYRYPEDPRPGIGWAAEPYPGRTPYTKDSELQNAETSAWGRAIIAAGAADAKRGIASAEEVRNRSADTSSAPRRQGSGQKAGNAAPAGTEKAPVGEPAPSAVPPDPAYARIDSALKAKFDTPQLRRDYMTKFCTERNVESWKELTPEQVDELVAGLEEAA